MTKRRRPEKETLEKMYADGWSQRKLAAAFDVSKSTIARWSEDIDVSAIRLISRPYLDESWLKHQYLDLKKSQTEIARMCGVSQGTISNAIRKFDIPTCQKEETVRKNIQELKRLYSSGWSQRKIAKHFQVDQKVIYKIMREFGIEAREPDETRANHVRLGQSALEFINGELLGDGCLFAKNDKSACYEHGSQYPEYLDWLSRVFEDFGLKQMGHIHMRKTNWSVGFYYQTLSYRELLPLYRKWYPDGKKIVPRDLKLTPLTCRQWMIGDGYLGHPPFITFATYGFSHEDIAFLAQQLVDLGFQVSLPSGTPIIRIQKRSVQDFLDFIGPCPDPIKSLYGYKWDLQLTKSEWIKQIRPRLLEQLSINQEKGGDYNVSN